MGVSPWSDETSVRESVEKGAHMFCLILLKLCGVGGGEVSKRASVLDIAQIVSR